MPHDAPRSEENKDGVGGALTEFVPRKVGDHYEVTITLIETRGEGGLFLCAPSPGYVVEQGSFDQIPAVTAEEREILIDAAKALNENVKPAGQDRKSTGQANSGELLPGQDFNERGDVRAILRKHGWEIAAPGENELWRRPGKDRGWSASLRNGVFYVFSSNAAPFESERGHSPFLVFALLEHNGDFAAAAKALSKEGYGTRTAKSSAVASEPRIVLPERFRPFPVEALPPLCAEFVRQSSASIYCDRSMVALPFLASAASAIGNSCQIELKPGYTEPSVLWAAIVCESGARKSPALEAPLVPLRKREMKEINDHRHLLQQFGQESLSHKLAVKEWEKKGRKEGTPPPKEPTEPICRRFTVNDVTAEALAVRLEQNPRGLLLIRDELSGFFGSLNQYKAGRGADEAAYLAMFSARHMLVDRKNLDRPSIVVPRANLSIVGSIQPGILKRMFTRERMESGMAARFLLTYPPTRVAKWQSKSVDNTVSEAFATMFDRLLSIRLVVNPVTNEPEPARLPLTRDARDLWISFHDQHSAEQADLQGDISAAWAKLTGYAARLALIVELAAWAANDTSDDPPPLVSGVSMQSGITLANWLSFEAQRVYQILTEGEATREVRELVEYVQRHGGQTSARDLKRGPKRYRDNPDLAEADLQKLSTLKLGEWVDLPAGEAGGRPTQSFRLFSPTPCDETSGFSGDCEVSSLSHEISQQNLATGPNASSLDGSADF